MKNKMWGMILQRFRSVLRRISKSVHIHRVIMSNRKELGKGTFPLNMTEVLPNQPYFREVMISQEMNIYPQVVGNCRATSRLILFPLILTSYHARKSIS